MVNFSWSGQLAGSRNHKIKSKCCLNGNIGRIPYVEEVSEEELVEMSFRWWIRLHQEAVM